MPWTTLVPSASGKADELLIHWVAVPVEDSTCPAVPTAFVLSFIYWSKKQVNKKRKGNYAAGELPIQAIYSNTGETVEQVYSAEAQKVLDRNFENNKKLLKTTDPGITGFTNALKKGELDDMFVLGVDFLATLVSTRKFANRFASLLSFFVILFSPKTICKSIYTLITI